jgi:hypothetical protein
VICALGRFAVPMLLKGQSIDGHCGLERAETGLQEKKWRGCFTLIYFNVQDAAGARRVTASCRPNRVKVEL